MIQVLAKLSHHFPAHAWHETHQRYIALLTPQFVSPQCVYSADSDAECCDRAY